MRKENRNPLAISKTNDRDWRQEGIFHHSISLRVVFTIFNKNNKLAYPSLKSAIQSLSFLWWVAARANGWYTRSVIQFFSENKCYNDIIRHVLWFLVKAERFGNSLQTYSRTKTFWK